MAKKKQQKRAVVSAGMVGKGLGIATLAAAGAALLYGKEGAKRKKAMKNWAAKMKKDVTQEFAELKDTGESAYKKIVDKAAAEYKKFEDVDVSELATLAKDLKSQWKIFQSGAKKSISRTKRKVSGKKTVKKSAKKS